MEYGSRLRFVLLSLGGIILLILSAWGVTALARSILKGGDKKEDAAQVQKIDLTDYSRPSTSVKIEVRGPVVADEEYYSYEIEIGQDFRRITTYKGYGKAVVASKRYDNNKEAYDVFLKSLKKAGYTNTVEGASDDETGSCPTGKRYIYEVVDLDEQAMRKWNTSCSGKSGSFGGASTTVRALFKSQIPDYTTIIKTIKFSN